MSEMWIWRLGYQPTIKPYQIWRTIEKRGGGLGLCRMKFREQTFSITRNPANFLKSIIVFSLWRLTIYKWYKTLEMFWKTSILSNWGQRRKFLKSQCSSDRETNWRSQLCFLEIFALLVRLTKIRIILYQGLWLKESRPFELDLRRSSPCCLQDKMET